MRTSEIAISRETTNRERRISLIWNFHETIQHAATGGSEFLRRDEDWRGGRHDPDRIRGRHRRSHAGFRGSLMASVSLSLYPPVSRLRHPLGVCFHKRSNKKP